MQIVVKMKVILSPPGRILNEQPLTARVPRQPVPRERGGGRFVLRSRRPSRSAVEICASLGNFTRDIL